MQLISSLTVHFRRARLIRLRGGQRSRSDLMSMSGLPGLEQAILAVHGRVQVEVDEDVLAVDEAELVRGDHDVVDEVGAAAEKNDAELDAHVVHEDGLDGPRVLLVAYLVVDGDLGVEQGRLERRHRQIAVEVGDLLLVVLVEQEDDLLPVEVVEHFRHELVQPVHGRTDVSERFVFGELVLAKVLRHRAYCDHCDVPKGCVTSNWRQRTFVYM